MKTWVRIGLMLGLAALGVYAMFDDVFESADKGQETVAEAVTDFTTTERAGKNGKLF